jgi:hypothetical protein
MMMMRSGSRRWPGWSWTMAWPRPFDSADITYASAPSHQTTRTTSLDCLFGRGWYAKAEHRARELHQAMTFVILQYCYSLALLRLSMSAINKTSHNPRFQFQGHPIPSHKNPLKKPKRVCPMARLIAFLPLPRASRCRLHDRPADSGQISHVTVLIIVAYQRSPCERAENSAGGVKEWRLWTR